MKKRGQATFLIITGLVIAFIVILILFLTRSSGVDSSSDMDFQSNVNEIENYIQNCLDKVLIDAVNINGIYHDSIISFMNTELETCLSLEGFTNVDVSVENFNLEVDGASEGSNIITAVLDYPVKIKKGDKEQNLKTFTSDFKLYLIGELPLEGGVMTDDFEIISEGAIFKIKIPKGTKVEGGNGKVIVRVVNVPEMAQEPLAKIWYNWEESKGTKFTPDAEMRIEFLDSRYLLRPLTVDDKIVYSYRGGFVSYPSPTRTNPALNLMVQDLDELR